MNTKWILLGCVIVSVFLVGTSFSSASASSAIKNSQNDVRFQHLQSLVNDVFETTQQRGTQSTHPVLLIIFILISLVEFVILVEYFVLMFALILYNQLGR